MCARACLCLCLSLCPYIKYTSMDPPLRAYQLATYPSLSEQPWTLVSIIHIKSDSQSSFIPHSPNSNIRCTEELRAQISTHFFLLPLIMKFKIGLTMQELSELHDMVIKPKQLREATIEAQFCRMRKHIPSGITNE